ncbi:efflux RND transporter periplasmic adaptor subunit [Teredinibacter haidensis]|uniref:efflux RND transporter periplasmic adaptor subunit n=1 Tax=Teredinibacter haidensis TaxID=2731755 RepID=UPI0009489B36|nr:efflux RND transporter periplasmic adaptor subunit [Teredinibacter haidensis]
MKARLFVPLILMSIVFLSACGEDMGSKATAVELVRPAKLVAALPFSADVLRQFPGTTEASSKSDLAFRVGGQLNELLAVPGKAYKKGALLAALDEAEYRNQLADRQAHFQLAQSQFKKMEKLLSKQFISPSEFDAAEAQLKAAEAALAIAKDNLQHTQLKAPFDGVVAHLQVENYQTIGANIVVMQFRSEGTMDVRFSIPESLLGQLDKSVDPTQICSSVRFVAYPIKAYTACFKEYDSNPDRLTRSYSIVYQLPSIAEFPVLPGMAVSVELDLGPYLSSGPSEAVLVPVEAVFQRTDQSMVWKLDEDMRVHQALVAVAGVEQGYLIIEEGLVAGDTVVAAGVSYLSEGLQVKPIIKERGL